MSTSVAPTPRNVGTHWHDDASLRALTSLLLLALGQHGLGARIQGKWPLSQGS